MRKVIQLFLQTMLLSTVNYLILAIFQQMSNIRLIGLIGVNIIVNPFKVTEMLSVKDSIPKSLKSFVVYNFVCQDCNPCYIGETTHYFSTRIK